MRRGRSLVFALLVNRATFKLIRTDSRRNSFRILQVEKSLTVAALMVALEEAMATKVRTCQDENNHKPSTTNH